MAPFKNLKLTLEALNQQGTYSEGDTVIGTLSFNLKSDTKVKSISVKAKGDAKVEWKEDSGNSTTHYKGHVRYFKLKQDLVAKDTGGTVLRRGPHNFTFSFQIPQWVMPSSFEGKNGKIVYMVEAKISRSWRWPSSVKTEINFFSRHFPSIRLAMHPLSGSVDKEVGIFSSGQLHMTASVNQGVCSPGDTLSASARIRNASSKSVKPKFSLHQKVVYSVKKSTKTSDKVISKMVGDTITPRSEVTVPCEVKIPVDAACTLCNCQIISLEYYLKVYLDVSFAFDPEVVFPLLVVPPNLVHAQLNEEVGLRDEERLFLQVLQLMQLQALSHSLASLTLSASRPGVSCPGQGRTEECPLPGLERQAGRTGSTLSLMLPSQAGEAAFMPVPLLRRSVAAAAGEEPDEMSRAFLSGCSIGSVSLSLSLS
ncbi:arrestin domain-containing protein 3-like [Salarias fasciatus]|uniref:arrestin domain-containing protein 3-like n=1 Tax=Salarias fasciatus TaxID=181472 RepID=UPI00117656DD|nr:arrestin domain-containing protein 3-like [Salarias fasciatus]